LVSSINPISFSEITAIHIELLLSAPKSIKMSIQITAVTLTAANYSEYLDLIPTLSRLKTLIAFKQPTITEIPAELPDSLKEINIIMSGLAEIRALPKWLEYLYCQMNNLASLPERMPRNLRILNCSDNHLARLPQLPQTIKVLYCSGNPLKSVPNWLPDSLTMLDISRCGITELPDRLPKSLTNLKCYNNKLVRLPSVLPSELSSLDCSFNQITEIPQLPYKLLVIDASHNQLSIFDFNGIRQTMSIRLDSNPDLPEYRHPLTLKSNIEYNHGLTQRTLWSRRMKIMKSELLTNSHRICYAPSRVERLVASGELDITELAGDL